jgi:predicted PurR-regulated permease PerM
LSIHEGKVKMAEIRRDITRDVLAVLFLVALIGSSIWILRPFLGAVIWATTIVVATWPLMTTVQGWLWDKRALAVTVMTLLLLCVLVVPLTFAIGTIVSNVEEIVEWTKSLKALQTPSPPEWVVTLPVVGSRAADLWRYAAVLGLQEIGARVAPYAGGVIKWFAAQVGGVGVLLVEFLLTVILAAAMYANGERASDRVARFGRRLAGRRGDDAVQLAGQTIRGVALGVVVTALIQAVWGGLGLVIAGVPYAGVLTAVMLLLSVAQIGVVPVLGSAVVWVYWSGDTAWGTFLLVWTIIAATMDNFVRPLLIKKGANLPLLLVFSGVVGGLLAFGLIGIFVGPVVLAVADAMLSTWIDSDSGGTETNEGSGSGGG